MTDTYTTPGSITYNEKIPKEVLDNVCTPKDKYEAPEIPKENSYENKNQPLISDSTKAKPSSCSECKCQFIDKITDCFCDFLSPEILFPIGSNILLWIWMSVMILNYANIIDLPRKNLYTMDSWSFLSDAGGSGEDGLGILGLIIIMAIIFLIPLLYPELIFGLFYALYIYVNYYKSSKTDYGDRDTFKVCTWLTFSTVYRIFYACCN